MKMEQNTTKTSTALLCNANGVDTQETESLCCAAAGIIDPISATTEVLIPHEKLREAATPDATLIAQNRPPAQPVEGYKSLQKSRRKNVHFWDPSRFAHSLICTERSVFSHIHVVVLATVEARIRKRPPKHATHITHSMAKFNPLKSNIGDRHSNKTDLFQKALTMLKPSRITKHDVHISIIRSPILNSINCDLSGKLCYSKNFMQKFFSLVPCIFKPFIVLVAGNPNRNQYRNYRPNGLDPSSCLSMIGPPQGNKEQDCKQSQNSRSRNTKLSEDYRIHFLSSPTPSGLQFRYLRMAA